MNVRVGYFGNPFSFHCIEIDKSNNFNIPEHSTHVSIQSKTEWSDVNHGQYIAVWHDNKWTRGVVSMESQVLIWLVDCGYYLRPEDSTIYVELSAEYKKLPSKVFEASIHGVVPVDKVLSDECEIKDQISTSWNSGAIHMGQNLINSSTATYFVPIALMSTKGNDVVLGDLYLDIPYEGIVNIIDKMETWPVFLQRNPIAYIEGMSQFYTSRRKHHASLLKPQMEPNSELPVLNPTTSLEEYQSLVDAAPKLELEEEASSEDNGSTVVGNSTVRKPHLTPFEIEEYSNRFIKVNGKEYNVLNVIINKTRDLIICEQYKNRKSVGRATSRWSLRGLAN